jgi:hypothetical protein
MSALVIVLIVLAAILLALFIGGLLESRRRAAAGAGDYARRVAAADQALEQARAADKGWDRAVLEDTARQALAAERPDWRYGDLHLVLVDDRPGVTEDRAHFMAVGEDGEIRVVLVRREAGWAPERVE